MIFVLLHDPRVIARKLSSEIDALKRCVNEGGWICKGGLACACLCLGASCLPSL